MGKQQAQFGPRDYNQTTEPVERVILPQPLEPTTPMGGWYPGALHPPGAHPYVQAPDYPVLPPAPFHQYRGQPPGGSPPVYHDSRASRRQHSLVPGLVRFCFVLVQLTLLARVVCMLFGVTITTLWLSLLFFASDVFVLPLRWLASNINVAPLAGTPLLMYLEFLLAIFVYRIVSRLLVGLLKALFRG